MDFIATARRQMLVGQLEDSREHLLNSFAGLSDEEMLEPGVAGEWSVRDVLAHVAAWDRAQVDTFREMLKGNRPELLDLDLEGIDRFNQEHQLEMKGASLQEVITELHASRKELLEYLNGVSNAQLFAPAPGDDHADLSIAACIGVSVEHDDEHAAMIEEWREMRVTG